MAGNTQGKQVLTRCLHVAFDAEAYSARTTLEQRDLQQRISDVLYRAIASIGLEPRVFQLQPQGDGGLLRLPAAIDEAAAVSGLIRELRTELATVNRELIARAQVRMRLAFFVGLSQDAALGFAGDAPVHVGRLVNSSALRERLKSATHSSLAVIIPDTLFQELVANRLRGLDPSEWELAHVVDAAKNFACAAWLTVPGNPPSHQSVPVGTVREEGRGRVGRGGATAAVGAPREPIVQSIEKQTTFNGPVNLERGDFNIN
jgi:hypothetical protein